MKEYKKIVNDLQIFDAINVQNWEKEKVLEIYKDYVDLYTLKKVKKEQLVVIFHI